jgi:hypothetical protein
MSIHKGYLATVKDSETNNLVLYHEHYTRTLIKLHQTKNFAISRFLGHPATIDNVNRYIQRVNRPLYLVEFDVVLVNETPVLDYLSN